MSAYGKIIQNLTKKIEVLMNNGDNHNGKIDTTNEKNELAHLLSGAKQEIEDLYTKMINGLDNQAANISKKNYDAQYNKLENEKKMQ